MGTPFPLPPEEGNTALPLLPDVNPFFPSSLFLIWYFYRNLSCLYNAQELTQVVVYTGIWWGTLNPLSSLKNRYFCLL